MQKAGSLIYAIYICLLISILTGGLILLVSLNKEFSGRLEIQDLLVDRCQSCLEFYFSNRDDISLPKEIDLFEDGLVCKIDESDWGIFKSLRITSFFKKDTVVKRVMVGKVGVQEKPALYLADLGEELKITGNTKIIGDVLLPQSGYKKTNILGNNKLNKPFVDGVVTSSNQSLPEIDTPKISFSNFGNGTPYSKLRNTSTIYNGFDKSTLIIDLESGNLLNRASFKGNIMLISNDTLTIGSAVSLQDVIVRAPKVIIEDNVTGRFQIFADKEIVLGKNVYLQYPSSAVVWSRSSIFDKSISVSTEATIEGPVILGDQGRSIVDSGEISIAKDATIFGDLYCKGSLELKGNIFGTVFTNKFLLRTKNGEYTNTLMDATISTEEFPEKQLGFVLSNTGRIEKINYGIVKQL